MWREISPKAEVLAQVGYLCGLPGKLLAPLRPCAEDRSFTSPPSHFSQLPSQAPLQPRLPPRVSRGPRCGVHSHHTQQDGEADTRGIGGAWNLARGTQAGSRDRRAAAQAESRTFQGRNTVTLGMLRDSETLSKGSPRRGSSCQSLLCGLALCPSTSFYAHASSSEGGSGCPGPSSPACFSLLVSTDPGLFPSTDRYMPKRR